MGERVWDDSGLDVLRFGFGPDLLAKHEVQTSEPVRKVDRETIFRPGGHMAVSGAVIGRQTDDSVHHLNEVPEYLYDNRPDTKQQGES